MNKRNIKILAILLASMLLIGLFIGCSNKDSGSKSVDSNKPPEGSESVQQGQKASSGPEPLKLPIVTEPLTLTVFAGLDGKVAATMKSYDDVAAYKAIEKLTGINIEWQHPPAGQEKEQFNLMMASQELPDVIDHWGWGNQIQKYANEGAIIRLNDLIAQYAPNFTKVLDENPDVRKQMVTDDGSIYYFPQFRLSKLVNSTQGFQVRKDWLDKLKLSVPQTIDDWYNVLKAFKEKDPNGNGKNDEIPFVAQGIWGLDKLIWAWGVPNDFYQENGKVNYGPISLNFKEALSTLRQWYKEGLIDPDFASTDSKQWDAKVTTDIAGAYYGRVSGNMGRYLGLMKDKNPGFQLVGAPYPKLNANDKPYTFNDLNPRALNSGAAITSKNKHLKETVKLYDFNYSEQGHMLMNFGIEGESYTMVNGEPVYTDLILHNPDGLPVDQALAKFAPAIFGNPAMIQDERYFMQTLSFPAQKEAVSLWGQAVTEKIMPSISLTDDESNKLSNLMTEINTYRDEMFNKFIMGQESLDDFDKYVQTIKGMGIDEAIKIQQTALDRFKARK